MITLRTMEMTCLLITTLLISSWINISVGYKAMTVENGDLCSPITKRKIRLGEHEDSALIVSQKRLNEHSIEWNVDFKCSFKVDASSDNEGVFAVIQELVFRKNEVTNECIDYIQFKRRDGSTSSKYCGYLNAELSMGKHFAPYLFSNNLAPAGNSFVDPGGQLVVTIFVSKEPLIGGEEMELRIVFTSYKTCFFGKPKELFSCSPEQKDKCIYSGFHNDGFINCPYPDCVDEDGCSEEDNVPNKKSNGNVVLVSSLSTLAALFCIFIISVYLCRKYGKLCWSQEFANPAAQRTQGNAGHAVDISGPTPVMAGLQSDPRYAPQAPPAEEDKDLPPSYESLFPNR